jgi:hypothetical protein
VRRRRLCVQCSHRFTTWETEGPSSGRIAQHTGSTIRSAQMAMVAVQNLLAELASQIEVGNKSGAAEPPPPPPPRYILQNCSRIKTLVACTTGKSPAGWERNYGGCGRCWVAGRRLECFRSSCGTRQSRISRWVTLASGWVLEQRKKPLACLPPIEGITLFRSSSVSYLPSCSSSDCSFCWPSIDQVRYAVCVVVPYLT